MSRDVSAATTGLLGLNERMLIGSTDRTTTSLDNVIVRNGNTKGRKGLALWDGINTAASDIIVGFMTYYDPVTASNTLLRLTTTKVEKWNDGTNAWDDITGTALGSITTSDRPAWEMLSDEGFLVFTDEGHTRPRKWTGTGNTVQLGGTPPFAKALAGYVGFLFLGNTSTDGTFSAVADALTAYFSDEPDISWDLCEENTIIYDESPGEIRVMGTFGEVLIVGKEDCIVQTRFAGGQIRFSRRKLPFAHGVLAPMSFRRCGEFGYIFLATDRNLYVTNGQDVIPLPLAVQKSLQETMNAAKAPFISAYVDLTHETYHLLYQRNATTYFDGRLSYNYRTKEFTRAAYTGFEFTRGFAYRQTNNSDSQLVVAASDKKVYEQENGTDDNGTAVTRYYDFDWYQYGSPGSKYFTGANLVFKRASNCQVKISVASDHSHKFQYSKIFSLHGFSGSDDNVRVKYEIPSPVYGSWFKFRIEMFHYGSSNVVELLECEPTVIPVHRTPQDVSQRTSQRS